MSNMIMVMTTGVFRSSAIAAVALVSVIFGALPAQAAITTDPPDPTIQPGGPSPAITLTSEPISIDEIKTV